MKQEVSIQLGMSGQDFVIALGREDTRTTKQPMGVNFYDLDWPSKLPGVVNVVHGPHGFSLTAVLGLMGTEDLKLPGGVQDIDINFGITPADLIPHDEARLQVMALLKRLQTAGWKQHYYFGEARIKGRSTLAKGSLALDARYTPTFEEWMALGNSASWLLQTNGVYMALSMRRDSDRMAPYRPGAYLMSMTLKTEEQEMRGYFDEPDRGNWRTLWSDSARLKRFQDARMKSETQARAKGLEIDTQYQDPAILALKKD
ncbi:hypothetical protein [Rhodoferax aquaticus]|uniref:Uncharacterized protein n=1 Tax=Rhodoferax aquaticus TaxID=2527691 RepID=A0A515EPU4_9BURK|nr:hypothetical protein [Rhodoferax aquaticus]QDL54676.1 hypothetical protein EXZ61_11130 [Rhodoferax aquaticus]